MSKPEASPVRELDVRPMLRAGEEPFQAIMDAVGALAPGESLRLIAPFRPVPLFSVMANRGFAASDRALDGGDWEVLFSPVAGVQAAAGLATGSSPSAPSWGDPIEELDLIDLEPPEPMVQTLEALERLPRGKTLLQINVRVPQFLLPQLAARGFVHEVRVQSEDLVRIFIRHAHPEEDLQGDP